MSCEKWVEGVLSIESHVAVRKEAFLPKDACLSAHGAPQNWTFAEATQTVKEGLFALEGMSSEP